MAVTGVATADYNTVRTSLEGTKNKHGIDTAGAGHANDLYLCRIVQAVTACKVGTRIGAPVAAEGNYKGLEFFYLHIASTSAMI